MKVNIDKYPIVKITWVDATDGESGWVSFDDIIGMEKLKKTLVQLLAQVQ